MRGITPLYPVIVRQETSMGFARNMLLGLAIAGVTASGAQAETIRDLFGDGTQKGCYKRVYDEAHFVKNPKQRVKVITFDFEPQESATARASTGPIRFGVSVIFRSRADGEGGAPSYCKDAGGKITCYGEADAGTFEVTREGSDSIMLRMTRGLGCENSTKKGFVSMEDGPDDKVFVLRKAQFKACNILQ
jgi:hypothetical protein